MRTLSEFNLPLAQQPISNRQVERYNASAEMQLLLDASIPLQHQGLRGGLRETQFRPPTTIAHDIRSLPLKGALDAFKRTCDRWRLGLKQQSTLLGHPIDPSSVITPFIDYVPPVTRDVRDRIGYVIAISLGLGALFDEDAQRELQWLRTTHKRLAAAPIDYMLRGRMIHLIDISSLVKQERGI